MIPNIPLSKDELRQRLNLPYVCMRLGIVLDANGRGLCPGHEVHGSHTPSLRLWTGDDGTQLWWCDPCNIGGDVFSLIMRVEGCSFPGAIQRSQELLEELPPDYAYDVIVAPDSAGPDDWTQDIADGAARAVANPGAMAVSVGYCDATQVALAYQWDDYLRTIWGWGIDADGAILQPHWSPELPEFQSTYSDFRAERARRFALAGSASSGRTLASSTWRSTLTARAYPRRASGSKHLSAWAASPTCGSAVFRWARTCGLLALTCGHC